MANVSEFNQETPTTLAAFLRQMRSQLAGENGKRMSLTAMHRRCGLSVPVLSKLETGRVTDPSGSTIKRVLEGYQLSFDDFARYLPGPK
ncbi:helix-turn-helix domain-containing protein [Collimonas silvisoli]|uniref:helix-turn-helix domain-containing protein n=1 Tax=Collimonas silvisoli TaxID=2825884 RepID=UPI001B8D377C|nr:helix-turn-helix transcriptional regulator [Collimonas silvisoli]